MNYVKKVRCEKCGALLPLDDLYDLFDYTKKNNGKTDKNNSKLLCFNCCLESIATNDKDKED